MVSATTERRAAPSDAEIDLVADLQAEAVERVGGVVPAAEEAPVDQFLDPAPRRPEQGCHGKGRGGDREIPIPG